MTQSGKQESRSSLDSPVSMPVPDLDPGSGAGFVKPGMTGQEKGVVYYRYPAACRGELGFAIGFDPTRRRSRKEGLQGHSLINMPFFVYYIKIFFRDL